MNNHTQPFKRMRLLIAAVNAAHAHRAAATAGRGTGMEDLGVAQVAYDRALQAFYSYESRGHGGRHRSMQRGCMSRSLTDRSKYMPHQGKREMARRFAIYRGECQ